MPTPHPEMTLSPARDDMALWPRLIVILCALLSLMGAVIALARPATLVSPHDEINGAVRIFAGYFASRNIVIALLLMSLLVVRAWRSLGNLMVLVGLIQVVDAVLDCTEARWTVAPGVLILGLLFLAAAARLTGGQPFWRRQVWIP